MGMSNMYLFFYFCGIFIYVNIYEVVVYFHTHHALESYELVNVYPVISPWITNS
jgi:hypothetical protein